MSTGELQQKPCCSDLVEKLSDYHDGRFERGSAEAERVEQHLATCTRCAEVLEDYRAISSAARILRAAEVPGPDPALVREAVARALGRVVFMRRLAWGGIGLTAAAAVAATVVAVVLPPKMPRVEIVRIEQAAVAPEAPADREKLVNEIITELKARPGDLDDEGARDRLMRRLKAAGFAVEGTDPSTWVVADGGEDPSGQMRELMRLIREAHGGRARGVLQVDDPSR